MAEHHQQQQQESQHHEHHHEHQHHEHHEEEGLKHQLVLIIVTSLLLVGAIVIEKTCSLTLWQLLAVYLVPYLLIGWGTLREAVEGLLHGEPMNEHLLMAVATIGALCIGFLPGAEQEYKEAVFVMLFFAVGELFEGYAEGQSRRSIAHLMELKPDVARVTDADGEHEVAPEGVSVGQTIEVRAGERVPLDGIITEGSTSLNTVALTGESMPREATVGDAVPSGCVNLSGVIRLKVTKVYAESTVARIIELVEHATENKSKSETFITRFARIYTPIVVVLAVLIAVIPPLLLSADLSTWIYRALMFLVVSCPCALVISVPLTFFGGIGCASRNGILIKGSNFIDILAGVDTVVFDKTGTLTQGRFSVSAVHNPHNSPLAAHLLHLAAHVEHYSTHPIAAALRDVFPEESTDGCEVSDVEEVAGQGIRARVNNKMVCVGNERMMQAQGISVGDCEHCHDHATTVAHVSIDGEYAGHIVISDTVKPDAREAIEQLRTLGVRRTLMLTGDSDNVAADVARQTGIDEWHAGLMPQDKVRYIDTNRKGSMAFVGDGINDAPVLARADVGVAMGALGSDAAIEAADVVLMSDRPSQLPTAIAIARRTIAIARQNVVFAIGVKVSVLVLAALGIATMGAAVFADVGVTVLAVLNAMRALKSTAGVR